MTADFTTHLGCRVRVFEITDEGGSLPGTYLSFDMGQVDGRYAEVHLSPADLDSLRRGLTQPVLSAGQFRDLCFAADLAFLRTFGPDAEKVQAGVRAVLTELGYEIEPPRHPGEEA